MDSNNLRRVFMICFGLFGMILAAVKIADAHSK